MFLFVLLHAVFAVYNLKPKVLHKVVSTVQ